MQVCRRERGSVCHASARNLTWLSLSTARQRQPPTLPGAIGRPTIADFLQTDSRTHGAGLISGPTHGDKAAGVGHPRLPPPAASGRPPSEGVHKSPSRLAFRQAVESYLLRIRPLLTLNLTLVFYDPVVLG